MRYPLAVFCPRIGARSETFVRRHARDLAPGMTVVMGRMSPEPDWTIDTPFLDMGRRRLLARFISARLPSAIAGGLDPVRRFLRRHGVEVLLGEYLDTSMSLLPLARKLGIRVFAHAHGYDVSEKLRSAYWRQRYLEYNTASGVVTMSEVSRRKLVELGLGPEKVHVVPYGVDVPQEPPRRGRGGAVRCIAVGRMVEKKAPILLLDAFRRAAAVISDLGLEYIGTGNLLPAVRHFIRAFDLEERVTLHDGRSNEFVIDAMARADIFLQHSVTAESGDEEGLPVAILEAMAQGLPVVSTRHAGIPEAVVDGLTGCLVDEGDTMRMAEMIVELAKNPELAARLGYAAWERAQERYSWQRERADLLGVLGLESAGGGAPRSA